MRAVPSQILTSILLGSGSPPPALPLAFDRLSPLSLVTKTSSLSVPLPSDIGCGSGLSGEVLTDAGHQWIGLDIAPAMLNVAVEREVDGDVMLGDMGQVRLSQLLESAPGPSGARPHSLRLQGLPFRPGMFDGAISVSAVQWLCNADKASHNPRARINKFFQVRLRADRDMLRLPLSSPPPPPPPPSSHFHHQSLYNSLGRGARAALQVYPENPQQMELLTTAAMRCGFTGGLVVDYPNSTKAKKYFLCLIAGQSDPSQMPQPLTGEPEDENRVEVCFERSKRGLEASLVLLLLGCLFACLLVVVGAVLVGDVVVVAKI